MSPAGGQVLLDSISKAPSVNDGRTRLFGAGPVNGNQTRGNSNEKTGKRVYDETEDSYSNVIGGAYSAAVGADPYGKGNDLYGKGSEIGHPKQLNYVSKSVNMNMPPIQHHNINNIEQYYQ